MTRRKTKPVSEARICLSDTLSVAQTRILFGQIAAARGTPLVIDASAVQHLGAQCAQVLVAAGAAWRGDERPFTIIDKSPPFIEGVRLLGLADHLLG